MTAAPSIGRIDPTGVAILEGVGQHRLLSTRQIRELHALQKGDRWTRHLLGRLRAAGLVADVGGAGPGRMKLWFVTEEGADALAGVGRAETRRPSMSLAKAAGPLRQHTLEVNEIGIAFVRAARSREEDDCGPFDWFHEVAHSLGPPPGRRAPEQLISDAVLTYLLAGATAGRFSVAYRFVELDRANRSASELARRIARYARLYRHEVPDGQGRRVALWETRYPVFPGLLVVLAGQADVRLAVRRDRVLALCAADAELAGTPEVEVSICLLSDLVSVGPFAPIFRDPRTPDAPVTWLGEEEGG